MEVSLLVKPLVELVHNYCLTQINLIRSKIISETPYNKNAVMSFCSATYDVIKKLRNGDFDVEIELSMATSMFKTYICGIPKYENFIDSKRVLDIFNEISELLNFTIVDVAISGYTLYSNFRLCKEDYIDEVENDDFILYCLRNCWG